MINAEKTRDKYPDPNGRSTRIRAVPAKKHAFLGAVSAETCRIVVGRLSDAIPGPLNAAKIFKSANTAQGRVAMLHVTAASATPFTAAEQWLHSPPPATTLDVAARAIVRSAPAAASDHMLQCNYNGHSSSALASPQPAEVFERHQVLEHMLYCLGACDACTPWLPRLA